jgi:ankyrin repeat protein
MKIVDNQYIRLDMSLEEMAKIEIEFEDINKGLEDINIYDDKGEPNVVVYYEFDERGDLNNIYTGIKTMITNMAAIVDRWDNIPEYIENIIVYGRVYKNTKDKFDFLEFNSEERQREIIDELVRENRINECNIIGDTVLWWVCRKSLLTKALYIINNLTNKEIVNYSYENETALYWACHRKLEPVALILIDMMSDEAINKWNDNDMTVLHEASLMEMREVEIKLIERMSDEAINKVNIRGITALYYVCENNQEDIAIRLIERMSDEAINTCCKYEWNEYVTTSLYWACKNKMKEIAIRIIERMTKENINRKCKDDKTAINIAIENDMIEVVNAIRNKN